MYRRPKFLEVLLEIRQEMAREVDYDVDLFAEMVRSGRFSGGESRFALGDNKPEDDFNGSARRNRKSQTANRK